MKKTKASKNTKKVAIKELTARRSEGVRGGAEPVGAKKSPRPAGPING